MVVVSILAVSLFLVNFNSVESEEWISSGKIKLTLSFVEFYEGVPVYTIWTGTREKSLAGDMYLEVTATGLEENILYFNSNWTLTLTDQGSDSTEPGEDITGANQGTMNLKSRHFIEKGIIDWDEYNNNTTRYMDIVVSGRLSDVNFIVGETAISGTVMTLPPIPE